MNKLKLMTMLVAFTVNTSAMAFATNDDRIDDYLNTLTTASIDDKEEMLNRLQWSGLTDARLYDDIELRIKSQYLDRNLNKKQLNLVSYQVRALGYSGNEKYRATITLVSNSAGSPKLKRHALKAKADLNDFIAWNKLVADSNLVVEGKSAEVTTYMKMLNVNDFFVQRLAARAIYHEKQTDTELLDLAEEKLKMLYLKAGLDGEWQDTAAWLCKAIGQSGEQKYIKFLAEVNDKTPYNKIRKYAKKYMR